MTDAEAFKRAAELLDNNEVPDDGRWLVATRRACCDLRGCAVEDIAHRPTGEWIAMGNGNHIMLTD